MPKGRSGIILMITLIALVAILVLLLRQGGLLGRSASQQAQIPIELRKIIPVGWVPLNGQPQVCNLDDDLDDEWLVLYRYDRTEVKNVYAARESMVGHSPIGGIVYDAQVNRVPQELGNLSPYRPALLVPYKLLPDFYTDKGQGYLGETDAKFYPYAPDQKDSQKAKKCHANELYFLGYSYLPLPTRFSIFRWEGREVGYRGIHFIGDAHVDARDVTDSSKPVTEVTTYNRLANHRSVLCEVKVFERKDGPGALNFELKPGKFTIDFCFGTPKDPAYPEAVLVALLRGGSPPAAESPTGGSFLTIDAIVSSPLLERLATVKKDPIQIMSVTNQGAVQVHPQRGYRCTSEISQNTEEKEESKKTWWCGAEKAYVQAVIILNGETRPVTAQLISIANEQVTADVHWRIINLTLD